MALDLPFAMAPMQHSGLAREHFIPSFDPCEHTMLHVRPLSRLLFSLHSRKVDGRLIKRTLLQYGLTPRSEIANKDYHPLPHFAHLTRLKNVVANFNSNEPLFVYLRRLRKDRLDEPTAVRMKRGHGSSCAFLLLLLGLSSLFTPHRFLCSLTDQIRFSSTGPFNTIWGANLETEFDDGFGDGQGIIQEDVKTAFGGVLAEFESQWRSVGGWI